MFNAAYNPDAADYTPAYDNSLHFSPQFREFSAALGATLIERHNLRGKTVVEIGCGKGDFLIQLCDQGAAIGWGFDRSFDPDRVDTGHHSRIHFVRDFYTAEYARRIQPDFVCCRQVLEHLGDPRAFLEDLRDGFINGCDSTLYVEVPNALFTLKDMGIWDLIYEHCAYYTLSSLTHLMLAAGFDVIEMGELFSGQFIFVEARPGDGRSHLNVPERHHPAVVRQYAAEFGNQYREKLQYWEEHLDELGRETGKPVIWGGGSKGVTFLNIVGAKHGIDFVVDLNPYKQGKYVPGTGQRVVPPDLLRVIRPTEVIVMNPIYDREITELCASLGLETRISHA
jgi:SAM-dependent methyltransferase